jgi:DNA polymerase-3 subunit epsilon
MDWPSSYLVFDFETTGLSPESDHIIQVGLCDVVEGRVTRRSGWLVNQNVHVPPGATGVHGITTGDIRDQGVSPEKSLRVLLNTLRKAATCVGHNIHDFDIPFLLTECGRLGMAPPDSRDYVDTAALFKGWKLGMQKEPGENHQDYADRILPMPVRGLRYSVQTCLDEFGIELDASTLHNATHDTHSTHLIFQALQKVV